MTILIVIDDNMLNSSCKICSKLIAFETSKRLIKSLPVYYAE